MSDQQPSASVRPKQRRNDTRPPIAAEDRQTRDRQRRASRELRDLERRYHTLVTLQRQSAGGVNGFDEQGHAVPLSAVEPERLLPVLRARVERLEALWARSRRKRETRAKIVGFGAILAELRELDDEAAAASLLATVTEILNRRVDRPRDRASLRELCGISLSDEPPSFRNSGTQDGGDTPAPQSAAARLAQARALIEAEDADAARRPAARSVQSPST